jgi:hypothetical protein
MDANEKVRRAIANFDAQHPHWEHEARERREREDKEAQHRAQRAQEAQRNAEQQQVAANNSKAWMDWVDGRITEHLNAHIKYWFGPDRSKEHEEYEEDANRGLVFDAVGDALGQMRAGIRKEFKQALEEQQRAFDSKLAALEEALKAVPGKLPVARGWTPESVTYQAEMISHDGALWQARRDTAQKPGGVDWVLVARAGRDAVTPRICGTYDAHGTYKQLDIVAMEARASSPSARIRASAPAMGGS